MEMAWASECAAQEMALLSNFLLWIGPASIHVQSLSRRYLPRTH